MVFDCLFYAEVDALFGSFGIEKEGVTPRGQTRICLYFGLNFGSFRYNKYIKFS